MSDKFETKDQHNIENTNMRFNIQKNRATSYQTPKEKNLYNNYSAKNSINGISADSLSLYSDYPIIHHTDDDYEYSTGICSKHGLNYTLICNNDNSRVCKNCIMRETDHQGHTFIPNAVLHNNYLQEREKCKALDKKYCELSENKKKLKENIKKQLAKKVDGLKQRVEQIIDEIKIELMKEYDSTIKTLKIDTEKFLNENEGLFRELMDIELFIENQMRVFKASVENFETYAATFNEINLNNRLQECLNQYENIISIPVRVSDKYINELRIEENLIVQNVIKFKKPDLQQYVEVATNNILIKTNAVINNTVKQEYKYENLLCSTLLLSQSHRFDRFNQQYYQKPENQNFIEIPETPEDNLLESCDQNFLSIEEDKPEQEQLIGALEKSIFEEQFKSEVFNDKNPNNLVQSVILEQRCVEEIKATNRKPLIRKESLPTTKTKDLSPNMERSLNKSRSFIKKKDNQVNILKKTRYDDNSVDVKASRQNNDSRKRRKHSNTSFTSKNTTPKPKIRTNSPSAKILTKRAILLLESVDSKNIPNNVSKAIAQLTVKAQCKKLNKLQLTDLDIAILFSVHNPLNGSLEVDFSDNKLSDDSFSICLYYMIKTVNCYIGILNFADNELTNDSIGLLQKIYSGKNNVPLHTLIVSRNSGISKGKFSELFNKLKKKYGLGIEY